MESGPSRTALATAYARAYHQVADRPPIFTDPLAAPLLGVDVDELTELSTRTGDQLGALMNDQARRLVFAARARFAEDTIARAVNSGTRQVVILGAGLDTFAYRNPYSNLRVFEIDHPATQAWKRDRLASAGIDCPETVTLVPVDFETQDLAEELESTEFSRTEPAVFIWLGVVFYLTPSAAQATLEYIAGQAQPVEVVFDYLESPNTQEERAHLRARSEQLAKVGEPFVTHFTPDEIGRQLRALGFTEVEDRPASDVVGMYLGELPEFPEQSARILRASRILRARR
ncbi:SAM-dependent methyltransferase [Mycolicibacterium agri]|uniref:S-adenosyl-L-methionine-dependent methyltransferase n=1 Tax=Mycolicibacterium agri TaxID=36811 RepID=A0A2A7N6T4_MYCAG|nr:class I SAM-dependent methyltransferase [Mycolicibacterium agri]PEG39576.1 SAM-dependent methyltransferase [Mycolicibacterium agri]GFG48582.1 S-adenosyl-L-methionine-dependent methyltransferase [Mycolicibacterium agri]